MQTALLPAFEGTDAATLGQALAHGGEPLAAMIRAHNLGPIWFASSKAEMFREDRLQAARTYMLQNKALTEIDALFERDGVPYAVMKGVGARERLYDDPSVRPSSDIDLLVSADRRVEAIRVLQSAGFQLKLDPGVVSHEAALWRADAAVDLHWDIFRPGRTRIPVVDGMLSRRRREHHRWVLHDDDALFVTLVHAAISKHVTSPMGLQRVADIARWWLRISVDWAPVHRQLAACGLKTAAWAVLTWVRLLAPAGFAPVIDQAIASLRPGPIRRAYLGLWIRHELPARLSGMHRVRLLLFSLVLHDRPSDVRHAIVVWRRARASAQEDSRTLRLAVEPGLPNSSPSTSRTRRN